jgi:Skp family chaperone for outer membrane proteins
MTREQRPPLHKDKGIFLWNTLQDIRKAVEKVAGAKGYDLILNSSETQLGVFYVGEKFDITEDVIVTLNVSSGKK